MKEVKSDIQIAREAKMQPINDILAKINVPDESATFSPIGRHIAKINLEYLDSLKDKFALLLGTGNKNVHSVQKSITATNTNEGTNTVSECIRIKARIKLAILDVKVKILATNAETSVAPFLEDQGHKISCLNVSFDVEFGSSLSALERTGSLSLQ